MDSRAHEARTAIERLYIEMRHLLISSSFKPNSTSGKVLREALRILSPEIYGSLNDIHKVELDGLVYVIDRLPKGIEQCRYLKLTSAEGYHESAFEVIVPPKRKRNCYRIDQETMAIEITRGRSEIYDLLTHLTFLYNEANKIMRHAYAGAEGKAIREWQYIEELVMAEEAGDTLHDDQMFSYLSSVLGRSFAEVKQAYQRLAESNNANSGLLAVVYWLGRLAHEESTQALDREVSFSPTLRERIGRHVYGEKWAANIKTALLEAGLLSRPLHIISANLHSVLNCLFAYQVLRKHFKANVSLAEIVLEMRKPNRAEWNAQVRQQAIHAGLIELQDNTGTNLTVQIFDLARIDPTSLAPELNANPATLSDSPPVIIVMDYAFGEQAYETMDELLKPLKLANQERHVHVESISIMGKAGILTGDKGDIMIPTAHVFEGTADNYPFQNDFSPEDFAEAEESVCCGSMITVLGTSLQNRDVLEYFKSSSWQAIGLEMEGAHYQKAIQAQALIRKNIRADVKVRYAYYASDNPLITGATLASGSLGEAGVVPTYLITKQILKKILA